MHTLTWLLDMHDGTTSCLACKVANLVMSRQVGIAVSSNLVEICLS